MEGTLAMKKWMQLWLPVLLWVGMIFYFSSQPYEKQDMRPTLAQYVDEHTVEKYFSWVDFRYVGHEVSIAHLGVPGFLEFFLRKGSHFSVYFVLAILLHRALSHYSMRKGQAVMLALLLTAAYAGFDEVHQSFTKDRTPLWQDSVLDTVGGSFGLAARLLFMRLKRRGSAARI